MTLQTKNRYLITIFFFYIIVLVYFMFFGFGRPQLAEIREYRYSLLPLRIPLWLPKSFSIDTFKLWVFALGNLIAFIPFGVLVPMVFKKQLNTYFKFIGLFLLFILVMETMQMVTYLGSFDAEDIMINMIGASIGFYSYKVSKHASTQKNKIVYTALSMVGLTLLTFFIAWIYNNTVTPYVIDLLGLD
ncbi:VanZ family protein [Robertmurraya sp. DFI.2.37]|uniref:VanZ family protein n=1 Tax=Robertmurraya sp. DFI.2.37 TaxID=3031819 RepID=UPI001CDA52B6|nr:VanZ family protein [Robertmurraya sp. DFI.2.37]MDF1510405.1 VanZ family protein [Robertmurraya sp. DFI.2.37]